MRAIAGTLMTAVVISMAAPQISTPADYNDTTPHGNDTLSVCFLCW